MLVVDIFSVYWDNKKYMVIRDEKQPYDVDKTVNPWWFAMDGTVGPRTIPLEKALIKYSYRLVADTIVNISSTPLEITRDWENNEDEVIFDYQKIRRRIEEYIRKVAEPPTILKIAQLLKIKKLQ